MSVFTAIVLLLVGIFIGSVFIFGQQYWHREIQKEEAIEVSASFRSFRVVYGRHDVLREVKINFEDHEPYYIDKPCVTEELLEAILILVWDLLFFCNLFQISICVGFFNNPTKNRKSPMVW